MLLQMLDGVTICEGAGLYRSAVGRKIVVFMFLGGFVFLMSV